MMTPDARVQEAVERANAWRDADPSPDDESVSAAARDSDDMEYGYACGLLASTPETERLRSALREYGEHRPRCAYHIGTYDEPRYCDCGLDSLLTPTRDPQ